MHDPFAVQVIESAGRLLHVREKLFDRHAGEPILVALLLAVVERFVPQFHRHDQLHRAARSGLRLLGRIERGGCAVEIRGVRIFGAGLIGESGLGNQGARAARRLLCGGVARAGGRARGRSAAKIGRSAALGCRGGERLGRRVARLGRGKETVGVV